MLYDALKFLFFEKGNASHYQAVVTHFLSHGGSFEKDSDMLNIVRSHIAEAVKSHDLYTAVSLSPPSLVTEGANLPGANTTYAVPLPLTSHGTTARAMADISSQIEKRPLVALSDTGNPEVLAGLAWWDDYSRIIDTMNFHK